MSSKSKNKRQGKRKVGILRKILILLIIVLIVLTGFIVYRTQKNGGGMQGLLSTLVGHDENTLKDLEPLQVLLMGVSTDIGAKLTDTIIVGTYNPQTQQASLLSIPRDTFVGTDMTKGTGSDKINALYQKSPEKTLEAVNKLTGLNIKYYMVIDNQALIKLVDIIGGVEYYVPSDMYYVDDTQDLVIDLKEGLQVLDGAKAEQLLRYRKGEHGEVYHSEWGNDDYARMGTQRDFIVETVKQTIQAKNIFKIKDIVDLVYEYVETNLSISTIKDYVPYAVNINTETIQSAVLPGTSLGPPEYPLWFFSANKKQTVELIEKLYNSDETDENGSTTSNENSATNNNTTTSSDNNSSNNNSSNANSNTTGVTKTEASKIKIEIINGSGSEKTLTKVKKALTDKGYKIAKTIVAESTSKTTIINKTNVDAKYEKDIKDILSVGNISASTVSSSNVDITIIIGKDYK